MSSAFWLLLYLAPLLALTAAVFAWLGWQWRGSAMQQPVAELETHPPAQPAADYEVHSHQIESELHTLRDDLKSAQAKILQSEDEAAKAHETARALETETHRLRGDLETLRADRDKATVALIATRAELEQLRAQPTAKEAVLSSTQIDSVAPSPEKPKRKRTTTSKAKKAAPAAVSADKRRKMESHVLQRAAAAAAALTQEPDDDLTRIKGIKPATSEQLRSRGIRTWRQIAQWNDDDLRVFSDLLGFKNRAIREKWREQASALHEAAQGHLL
jgi:predicted flap endonuclease-1-like 5' DNA nuclease